MARNVLLEAARVCASMLLAVSVASAAAQSEREPNVRVNSAGDLFAAGGVVLLTDEVTGDAFIAGGKVRLESRIGGDAFAAGGNVSFEGPVDESLYAAGGAVTVNGPIKRHLRAAGGDLTVASSATIGGKATLGGAHVDIEGAIQKHLAVAAESVRINGRIGGDAEITARKVELGPRAQIAGSLTYWSALPATIDPAATIAGGVTHRSVSLPPASRTLGMAAWIVGGVLLTLGLMGLGSVLILLLPNFTHSVERTFAGSPGKSFLLGLALLLGLPAIGLLFMITLLGIPLGLAVLFVYPLVIMLGYLAVAMLIGDKAMGLLRRGRALTPGARIVGLVGALLLLAMLQAVPVLGGLLIWILLLIGVGAWALTVYRRYHQPTSVALV